MTIPKRYRRIVEDKDDLRAYDDCFKAGLLVGAGLCCMLAVLAYVFYLHFMYKG